MSVINKFLFLREKNIGKCQKLQHGEARVKSRIRVHALEQLLGQTEARFVEEQVDVEVHVQPNSDFFIDPKGKTNESPS